VEREGVAAFVEFDQARAQRGDQGRGRVLGGGFEEVVDVGVRDGRAGGVVDDDVGGFFGELLRGGGDLVEPPGAAGDEFYAGEA
jgi:hypothetical protein